MDLWGDIFRDHWAGRVHPHVIERDDGFVNRFDSAASYFRAPRSRGEQEILDSVLGPVLDLAAGPGSYALYYQRRGIAATAADSSPGALEVCRRRGCSDVKVMDLRTLRLEPESYGGILIMGNTLGLHQTPATLPGLLRSLCAALEPGGTLICNSIDPLDTRSEEHLRYHEKNRDRGMPPGLVRIRLRYQERVGEWTDLWMPTDAELRAACRAAECEVVEERAFGHERLRTLRSTTGGRPNAEVNERDRVSAFPVETHGLTQVALAVEDPARSLRFYRAVLGVIAVYESEDFVQAQTPGSRDVLVFERRPASAGQAGGIAHFGFRLRRAEDLPRALAAIRGAGGNVREHGEFVPGEPYVFFTDPDGYEVEIWYELPTPVDPPG